MKDFIMALILPRRMVRFKNMAGIVSILVIFVALFIGISSNYFTMGRFVTRNFYGTSYDDVVHEALQNFPKASLNDLKELVIDNVVDQEIYTITLKNDIRDLNVKIVFDAQVDVDIENRNQLNYFNLQQYYDADPRVGTDYLLYIFTSDRMYFVSNMAKNRLTDDNYQKKENNDLKYFLPDKVDELVFDNSGSYDTSLWTREVDKNAIVNFSYDTNIYSKPILPAKRIISNLDQAVYSPSATKGVKYSEMLEDGFSFDLLKTSLKGFIESTKSLANTYDIPNIDNLVDGTISEMTDFTISNKTKELTTTNQSLKEFTYHQVLTRKDGDGLIDFTIVFDDNLTFLSNETNRLRYFDLEGYFKQQRTDNTVYLLLIYAKKSIFYCYDLGQAYIDGQYIDYNYSENNSVFERNDNNNIQYYLPASANELKYNSFGMYDTRVWTRKVSKDDVIDFDYDKTMFSEEITPTTRRNAIVYRAIFSSSQQGYSYADLLAYDVDLFEYEVSISRYMNNLTQGMIDSQIEYEKIYVILVGILTYLILPLPLCFLIWLLLKKHYLKRFREYYAIMAVTYTELSVITFILGFFISFDLIAMIMLTLEAIYFIFVVMMINTDKNNREEDPKPRTPDEKPTKLEYKKISETDVKVSRIG